MDNSVKLNYYKISKIALDIDNLESGENKIQLSTTINIMVPKDVNDPKCVITITSSFRSECDKNILSVTIQGFSDIIPEKSVSDISEDEKQSLLKDHIVPDLYTNLSDFISVLLENSHIDFMNIPPYDTITK